MPSIKVKFIGLNHLTDQIGKNEFDVKLDGNTFGDMLRYLEQIFGPPFRKAILNGEGEVDHTIQVVKNEEEWLARDGFDYRLHDGDELFFFMMIAGG